MDEWNCKQNTSGSMVFKMYSKSERARLLVSSLVFANLGKHFDIPHSEVRFNSTET